MCTIGKDCYNDVWDKILKVIISYICCANKNLRMSCNTFIIRYLARDKDCFAGGDTPQQIATRNF